MMVKMNIAFLGLLFNPLDEKEIFGNTKANFQAAANGFQWNLINGLDINLRDKPISIFNAIPVGVFPKYYKNLFLKTKKWCHKNNACDFEIGCINLHFIKQISRKINFEKAIIKWIKESNENRNIIAYGVYKPFVDALKSIKKLFPETNITLIVTDVPSTYGILPKNPILALAHKYIGNNVLNNIDFVDNFVILTEQMKVPLKIGNRPYVVIEGIATEKYLGIFNENNISADKKIILYTGGLKKLYGICQLVDAFLYIKDPKIELHICGGGDAEKYIKAACNEDSRIKFFGYVDSQKVLKLQQKCTALVNPRKPEGEYTKYSFPSKTMEYMLSGKPVFMYKLAGVPDEYDDYLFYFTANDAKTMANEIESFLTCDTLRETGLKARNFVLENKNSRVQCAKIIEMLKR